MHYDSSLEGVCVWQSFQQHLERSLCSEKMNNDEQCACVCLCVCMEIHTATHSLARHGGGGVGSPILICKSSLEDIRGSHLDVCQAMQAASCEMQIFFPLFFFFLASELCQLQTTAGVTNKVWIPLSCRCVCNV